MKYAHLGLCLILGFGLILFSLWVLTSTAGTVWARAALAQIPPDLERVHDPIVITGGWLPSLIGSPLDEIFVYVYRDDVAVQIPSQIDERTTEGIYVPYEDGQLDANDELVFMAADAGAWLETPLLEVDGIPLAPSYVVTATDSLDGGHAWAYLLRSSVIDHNHGGDYVSYDGENDRISGSGVYHIGFDALSGFIDMLSLGNSPDLLDRSKMRVTGTIYNPNPPITIPFALDEENLLLGNVYAIDGPVRVTRVSTYTLAALSQQIQGGATVFAYRSLVMQPRAFVGFGIPLITVHYHRFSMDWNSQVTGMVIYDANNSAGVTIDGIPDNIIQQPPTRWAQITGITGTVISVNDISSQIGGTQSTYYKDDATLDVSDTGDQRSYGDFGFQVRDPNPEPQTIVGYTYLFTDTLTNVGDTYVTYYDTPLQVTVEAVTVTLPDWIAIQVENDVVAMELGQTAAITVSVLANAPHSTPIDLSLQGSPPEVGSTFDPNPVTPLGSTLLEALSTLSLTSTMEVSPDTYVMTVTGVSGVLSDTAQIQLVVKPPERKVYLPLVLRQP